MGKKRLLRNWSVFLALVLVFSFINIGSTAHALLSLDIKLLGLSVELDLGTSGKTKDNAEEDKTLEGDESLENEETEEIEEKDKGNQADKDFNNEKSKNSSSSKTSSNDNKTTNNDNSENDKEQEQRENDDRNTENNSVVPSFNTPTKTVNKDTAAQDDVVIYVIRFKNSGNRTVTGVTISDKLDVNLEDVRVGSEGFYNADTRTIHWYIGDVSAGEEGFVYFTARVKSSTASGTKIRNVALIDSDQTDASETNQVATIVKNGTETAHKSIFELQGIVLIGLGAVFFNNLSFTKKPKTRD